MQTEVVILIDYLLKRVAWPNHNCALENLQILINLRKMFNFNNFRGFCRKKWQSQFWRESTNESNQFMNVYFIPDQTKVLCIWQWMVFLIYVVSPFKGTGYWPALKKVMLTLYLERMWSSLVKSVSIKCI